MKMRLLLALAELAVGFVASAFAQPKDTVDPQSVQQLQAIGRKSDEAFLKGDAAARAALFTQDAVLVTEQGPVYGRGLSRNIMQTCSRNGISPTVSLSTIPIPRTL